MDLPGVRVIHSSSNCKLTHLENVNYLPIQDTKKVQNFFENLRIVVSFNTVNREIVDFFKKNFELYNIAEVPVGYGTIPQYHIIVRNTFSNAENKRYLRAVKTTKTKKEDNLAKIEEIMTRTLKAKRRKTDIVKEVIENLK